MSSIDKYSDLWLNVWRYALIPALRPEVVGYSHDVLKEYSGGYIAMLLDPLYQREIIQKMLDAGVRIINESEFKQANSIVNMWTVKKKDFILVRWIKEPEFLRIYSLKFQEFAEFPIFTTSKELNWNFVKRKMREYGVPIIEKEEFEKLYPQKSQLKKGV